MGDPKLGHVSHFPALPRAVAFLIPALPRAVDDAASLFEKQRRLQLEKDFALLEMRLKSSEMKEARDGK